ncbi:hypothetical protein [Enteractinococcus coprophilus]|uniref:Uncharacterized protein n=1 Tax=Enteractinococcus coprophilus TaxID=1027633 RepID=A0A543AIL5_9MICC|nr:hypothetical protein [Enteractinococcus coprophilus]TQL72418.1 hypothetical protein FB556_1068 [Enteractinococcus coprophilus]
MSMNLDEASLETVQQRLLEELEAQQRLQSELSAALESERSLRLENDLLWAYLQRKYPNRVKDAQQLLQRMAEGSDLTVELQKQGEIQAPKNRTLRKRVRGALGKLPGVHRAYHGLKNLGK